MWIAVLISALELVVYALLMFMMPRITRRGLLFGVYVGAELAGGEEAAGITRGWYRCMTVTLFLCLAAGVALVIGGRALWALILPDLVLFAGVLRCYIEAHRAARRLNPAHGGTVAIPPPATASLTASQTSLAFPVFVTALGVVLGAAAVWYAWSNYADLPPRVPTHFSGSGKPDAWSDKSFASVMALPLGTLFMGAGMGVLACFLARAKRALRLKDKGVSLAAQERFRAAIVTLVGVDAILVTMMLAIMSFDSIRVGLGTAEAMSPAAMYLAIALTLFTVGAIVYIAKRFGQGGARLEGEAADLPLTNGLADNTKWKFGAIYFNRDDPSMFVEHRFGIGYTLNFANKKAVTFFVVFMLLVVVLPLVLALAQ
jgi:uncharacterized membrane protein